MKRISYCLFLLLIITASACSPRLYFPDRVQTTSFSGKNQAVINGSVKPQVTRSESNGIDSFRSKGASYSLDAAYSFADHWAVTAYCSNLRDRATTENFFGTLGGVYSGSRYELGAVYFKSFPSRLLWEASGSFSRGSIKRTGPFNNNADDFKANYNMYAGQISLGYKWDYIVVSIGNRTWLQHYYQFETNSTYIRDAFRSEHSPHRDITQYPFLLTNFFYNFEFGYKFIKFNTQIGTPIQLTGPKNAGFPVYMTFGLVFRIEPGIFNNKIVKQDNEKL